MSSGDTRWVLAVDHGTSATVGAVADVDPSDGWIRVGVVAVDRTTILPSVVASRPEGTVLTGRAALEVGATDPGAVVLRARSHLESAPDTPLTTWPRPTTPVDAATALVAELFRAESARRGSPPAALVLVHPCTWGERAREALCSAGRAVLSDVPDARPGTVGLMASPRAVGHRLGGAGGVSGAPGRVLVADLGGGGTEVALVAWDEAGRPGVLEGARTRAVGGEALDDALAQLVLDRACPELGTRIRFGGDLDAHRAWFGLRTGIRSATRGLSHEAAVAVPLPVLPPESPGPGTVTVTRDDLAALFAPGLEEIARDILGVVDEAPAGPRPALLVRGGLSELPGVRTWLAERTRLGLIHGGDTGAGSPFGPASGAAASTLLGSL